MTAAEIFDMGFRLIEERRAPADERGVDGIMILEKKGWKRDKLKTRVYVSAHYAKSGHWGQPLPYL